MNWPRFNRTFWAAILSKPAWASVFDGSYGSLTGLPSKSYSNPTRALNTAVQLSATREAQVSYPVDVRVQSLLLGNAQGTVTLQYADNSGMSTNLVSLMSGTNSTSGVLNLDNTGTVTLVGTIPAAKFVRIATAVNAGTATFTSRQGQEVLQ